MEAPKESRKVFSAVTTNDVQNKDNYFIESGDKIRYFFEAGALGKDGELLVDPLNALNKVGLLDFSIEVFTIKLIFNIF